MIYAASIVILVFGLSVAASAKEKLPSVVGAQISEMNASCKELGGKPAPSEIDEPTATGFKPRLAPLVEHMTLAESGVEIWAIDEGRYRCDGAASLFTGSGGSQVYVFARLADGSVKQVLMQGADGITLKRLGTSYVLSLRVACGYSGNPPTHANTIACDRPLVWNREAQTMDFAPLAQATFPFGKPKSN